MVIWRDNEEIIKTVARNGFFRAIVEIIKILSAVFFVVLLARYLGPADYGRWTFVLALMAFFAVAGDFGLPLIFLREGAKDAGFLRKYFITGIILHFGAGFFLFLILLFILTFFPVLRQDGLLLTLALFYTISNIMVIFINKNFQATNRMHFEALLTGIQQFFTVALIVTFVMLRKNVEIIMSGYLLANFIAIITGSYLVKKCLSGWVWQIDWQRGIWLLRQSWPLMAAMAFGAGYTHLDSILLRFFLGNEAVGIYGAQYRVLLIFWSIAGWYVYSIFPILSALFENQKEKFLLLLKKSVRYMSGTGIFFAFAVAFFAPQIVKLLYGQAYSPGVIALRVLIWFVAILFVEVTLQYALIAGGSQKSLIYGMGGSALLNLILNIVFIPVWGLVGAAIAALSAELLLLSAHVYFLRRVLPTFNFLRQIYEPLILTSSTAVFFIFVSFFANQYWAGLLALTFYVVGAFKLKIFDWQEARLMVAGCFRRRQRNFPGEI